MGARMETLRSQGRLNHRWFALLFAVVVVTTILVIAAGSDLGHDHERASGTGANTPSELGSEAVPDTAAGVPDTSSTGRRGVIPRVAPDRVAPEELATVERSIGHGRLTPRAPAPGRRTSDTERGLGRHAG